METIVTTNIQSRLCYEDEWIILEDDCMSNSLGDDLSEDSLLGDEDHIILTEDKVEDLITEYHDWKIESTSSVQTIDFLMSNIECFLCQQLMDIPTAVPCCGFVYCYECIHQWVEDCDSCPSCFEDLKPSTLQIKSSLSSNLHELKPVDAMRNLDLMPTRHFHDSEDMGQFLMTG